MAASQRLLFGLNIDAMTMSDAVARCAAALDTDQNVLVGVVNAAKVIKLRSDDLLRESLLECDLLLADGQSIVWASRLLGRPLPERVAGIDLFSELLELADRDHRSVYLLGAKPDVLATLRERITERFPGLRIAGSHDGYFATEESAAIAEDIRQAKADMIFLGMTSPKKEIFLGTYGNSLDVTVMHGVGGSFDILAGITKRAPVRWQRMGLEWLFRLLQEPRRLFRRYLTTNAAFAWLIIKERIRPTAAYLPAARVDTTDGIQ